MDRYIGLDVHSASCTAGVLSANGKRLSSTVLETNGKVLVEFLRLIPGDLHLIVEEGTHAAWLYEILSPHVKDMVVMSVPKSKGQKNDKLDAFGLAEKLRTGSIERRVYKGLGEFSTLSSLSKAYRNVMVDSVRVMNRIKGVYRSRGISTSDGQVYCLKTKDQWLDKLPLKMRPLANTYYTELDVLLSVREQALKDMLKEAETHRIFHILQTIPGLGPNQSGGDDAYCHYAISVSKQTDVLDILRSRSGDAQFIGLGSSGGRLVVASEHGEDARAESKSQSQPQKDFQGSRNHRDRTEETRRADFSALSVKPGTVRKSGIVKALRTLLNKAFPVVSIDSLPRAFSTQ
jgi:hypothetical protein